MSNEALNMPTLRELLAAIPPTRRNADGVAVHDASADEDQTRQIDAIREVLDALVNRLEPSLDAVLNQATATDEAKNAEQELFSHPDPEKEASRAEIAELKSRPPVVVEKIVERVMEVPAAAVEEAETEAAYAPDFTIIPDELAKYAEADESAEDFRKRAFSLLFRFGIAEGENFAGGGEPLTPDEKIKLLPMLIANFNAGNWLKLTEDLNPQA